MFGPHSSGNYLRGHASSNEPAEAAGTLATSLQLDPAAVTVAKASPEAAKAFPNDGVSLALLRRVVADARLDQPMVELPLVGPAGTLVYAPSGSEIDALPMAALKDLALRYRAFSEMDGKDEFRRYDHHAAAAKACDHGHRLEIFTAGPGTDVDCSSCGNTIADDGPIYDCVACDDEMPLCAACHDSHAALLDARRELLDALRTPPTTTTQVNLCIVRPDTLASGCSYANMLAKRGDGDGMVGRPTVFLSHAWRYVFKELVDGLLERFEGDPAAESVRMYVTLWLALHTMSHTHSVNQ